jgi:hypothetical protein
VRAIPQHPETGNWTAIARSQQCFKLPEKVSNSEQTDAASIEAECELENKFPLSLRTKTKAKEFWGYINKIYQHSSRRAELP